MIHVVSIRITGIDMALGHALFLQERCQSRGRAVTAKEPGRQRSVDGFGAQGPCTLTILHIVSQASGRVRHLGFLYMDARRLAPPQVESQAET